MVMARKRKNPDGSMKQPNPAKGLRRGIVKWAPPHIEGEDEASHARHVMWMQSEWKKKEKRHSLVTRKMDLTYSFRREYLTKEMVPLLDIKEKYPFLFDEKEVSLDYSFVTCYVTLHFKAKMCVNSYQLNSKNTAPVLLFKTRH